MNTAHWHLILNHIPAFGSMVAFLLLISSYIFKTRSLALAGIIVFIISALLTIPAFLTGEGSEEILENVVGKNIETTVETHEDAAKTAMIIMQATGIFALITFIMMMSEKRNTAQYMVVFATFLTLISFGMMARVATLGGKIRHTEIRNSSMAPDSAGQLNNEPVETEEEN